MYKVLQQKLWQPPRAIAKTLLIMKLTTFILITVILQVSANSFAQKITLSEKNASLVKVFDKISDQSGYDFLISNEMLRNAKPVTIQVQNMELKEVLKNIFASQPLDYDLQEKMVVVSKKEPSFLDNLVARFSAIDIRGKVIGENDEVLAGATVKVKGTNKSAITNGNGEFYLRDVEEGAVILVSFIGYVSQELNVKKDLGEIRLMMASADLEEVTINKGYYSTSKELNTGNTTTVRSNVISNQPVTNPLQSLAGRVAGLQIIETNGLPGSPIAVQIRGRNSINPNINNNPLYVVDGVPFSSAAIELIPGPNVNATVIGSPLSSISPSDIDRIEILKDADATAIYGSRGSNGVVLITTKKGSIGATSFTANYNRGYGTATRIPNVLSTTNFLALRRDAFTNAGVTPTAANAPELFNYDPNANFHWPKWLIGNSTQRNDAMATLSGGNGQTNYLISGNYHDENSLRSKDDLYRRSGFHLNINHSSKNGKLGINADVLYSGSNSKLQHGNIAYVSVIGAIPNYPVYDSEGKYNWIDGKANYAAQTQAYNTTGIDNLNAYFRLNYKIIKDLELKIGTGYNKISTDQITVTPARAINPTSTTILPNSRFATQYAKNFITEPMLSFSKKIAKHQLDILIGGTFQNNRTRGNSFTISGYTSDDQQESVNFGTVTQKSDNIIDYKYLSGYGRIGYNWDSRYVMNATFRRDGSSRFGAGKQFASFGSVGAAWVLGNEKFIKEGVTWLSYAKLRGSYGSTGNDGIPDYGYLSLYIPGVQYGAGNTLLPSQIANEDYRWEINRKLEMALELGLLKNRILFTSAYYRNRSGNQLVGYPLPSTTGFDEYQANLPALVQNKGWEFEINTTNIENKKFQWTSSANLTISDNKLINFPGIEKTSYASLYVEGRSLSIVHGYQFTRVNPDNGIPELIDQNKDGVFTRRSIYNGQNGDYIIIGQTNPKWFAGLDNTFSFKGLELNIFLQYTRQAGYNYIRQLGSYGVLNTYIEAVNYWKKPGDQNVLPKPFSNTNVPLSNYLMSDATFGDASFLRVKNVALNYTLPGSLTRWGVKECKVYLQAQNMFTITDYKVFDPEQSSDGTTRVPPLKVFTIGLQVSL